MAGNVVGFFFSPPLQPLCMFDPWHLPAQGEGRASPALSSYGGCKKQPKRARAQPWETFGEQ